MTQTRLTPKEQVYFALALATPIAFLFATIYVFKSVGTNGIIAEGLCLLSALTLLGTAVAIKQNDNLQAKLFPKVAFVFATTGLASYFVNLRYLHFIDVVLVICLSLAATSIESYLQDRKENEFYGGSAAYFAAIGVVLFIVRLIIFH